MTMVTITDYQLRNSEGGKDFFALILQGGLEIVQSQNGGMYATAKKVSIPSTFTEEICISLVGQQLPGNILKVDCEPYTYYLPETGEPISLSHRYEYQEQDNLLETSSKDFVI